MKKILISIVIAFLIIGGYSLMENTMSKLFYIGVFITVVGPIMLNYTINTLMYGVKKQQPKTVKKKVHKEEPTGDNKPKKINTDPEYIKLKEEFSKLMNNRKLNRQQLLDFSQEIDKVLGDHAKVYKGFEYKNDVHEVYTKLKSSKITTQQFIELHNKLTGQNT